MQRNILLCTIRLLDTLESMYLHWCSFFTQYLPNWPLSRAPFYINLSRSAEYPILCSLQSATDLSNGDFTSGAEEKDYHWKVVPLSLGLLWWNFVWKVFGLYISQTANWSMEAKIFGQSPPQQKTDIICFLDTFTLLLCREFTLWWSSSNSYDVSSLSNLNLSQKDLWMNKQM